MATSDASNPVPPPASAPDSTRDWWRLVTSITLRHDAFVANKRGEEALGGWDLYIGNPPAFPTGQSHRETKNRGPQTTPACKRTTTTASVCPESSF
eukprot:scaffold1534_cov267-Pinguiococcus_pyrenoidosus.AAC.21